jgi:macrodomain Ter protein organizer (MatP/YcbG family)
MADVPFTLSADPEAINKWIAESILNSEIGKTIRDAAIAKLGNWDFKREVEATVQRLVNRAAADIVESDENLKASIAAAVAKELTPELIAKLATAAVAKLQRDY